MADRPRPGDPHPALQFTTLGHGDYDLNADVPTGGTYVVFHRGSHCKWTRLMLKELDDRIGDFALRGIRVVAVSNEDRAATAALQDAMQLIRLPLGHDLDAATVAADWGLFLREGSAEENATALHWEPAQAWLRPDGTLGAIAVQSCPSLWPDVTNSLRAIDKTMNDVPERGPGA